MRSLGQNVYMIWLYLSTRYAWGQFIFACITVVLACIYMYINELLTSTPDIDEHELLRAASAATEAVVTCLPYCTTAVVVNHQYGAKC
jgi:hypothetical protein